MMAERQRKREGRGAGLDDTMLHMFAAKGGIAVKPMDLMEALGDLPEEDIAQELAYR